MPTGIVYATDLINVLKKKHASGTYSKMVFYLEACESGSMFDGLLPEGLDIYVTTASKPDENSWGTYCGEGTGEDPCLVECPPPEFGGVCLGDLYSVAWMEDSDLQDRQTQTLDDQYVRIAKRTAANLTYGSHVMQYGDMEISADALKQYMGAVFGHAHAPSPLASAPSPMVASSFSSSSKNVDQRDTDLFFFMSKYQGAAEGSNEQSEAYQKLNEVISQRFQADNSVKHLGELLFGVEKGSEVLQSVRPAGDPLVDNWDCLKTYVKTFEAHCGALTSYGKKHIRGIANICNAGITSEEMSAATAQACSS